MMDVIMLKTMKDMDIITEIMITKTMKDMTMKDTHMAMMVIITQDITTKLVRISVFQLL